MRKVAFLVVLLGATVSQAEEAVGMPTEEQLIEVVRRYESAANTRDTDAYRAVLALADERFTEVEDHIPLPFGAQTARDILRWIEEHPDFDYRVTHVDVRAYPLAPGVGYAMGRNEWTSPNGAGTGRFTFIIVRGDDGSWRILHGHWSATPVG